MRIIALLCLATLAACGADGPPVAPSQAAPKPGVSLSGEAYVGVTVR